MKKAVALRPTEILLLTSLALTFPLLFENALEHSFPMGYAGLFTQMAQQISDANFRLPMESPFYGPGGIPFAYPPFGLYFLAIFIKLTGKYFIFLRLLPPLLSLFAMVPLFYLTLELSGSAIAAAITVILTATSQDLYIAHVWAAGIVRAPAFFFALTSLYFFTRQLKSGSRTNLLLTGVFLGLAFMSHLMYGLFCFLWIWWWTLINKNALITIKDSLTSSLIGFLTMSVWVLPVLSRHGMMVFINAFHSHGGESTLSLGQRPGRLIDLFQSNIHPVASNDVLAVLVLLGMIALLIKREFVLPIFYLFIILIFPEGERFIFLLGCLIAGIGLVSVADWVSILSKGKITPWITVLLLIPLVTILWWNGFETLSRYAPQIENATFDLADYIRANLPADENYLALVRQDEAEWLPFLFQRQPLVSQWGSEWLGTDNVQTYLTSRFTGCQSIQDWSCVERFIPQTGDEPDHVVTYVKDRRLGEQMLSTGQWTQTYTDDTYALWSRKTN